MKKPHEREWMKEAYLIAKGEKLTVKKEHVKVLVELLEAMRRKSNQLEQVMLLAYQEACKTRKMKGLPIPPLPPSLQKGGYFDTIKSGSNRPTTDNRIVPLGIQGTEGGIPGPRALPPTERKTESSDS